MAIYKATTQDSKEFQVFVKAPDLIRDAAVLLADKFGTDEAIDFSAKINDMADEVEKFLFSLLSEADKAKATGQFQQWVA